MRAASTRPLASTRSKLPSIATRIRGWWTRWSGASAQRSGGTATCPDDGARRQVPRQVVPGPPGQSVRRSPARRPRRRPPLDHAAGAHEAEPVVERSAAIRRPQEQRVEALRFRRAHERREQRAADAFAARALIDEEIRDVAVPFAFA